MELQKINENGNDVHRFQYNDKELILIGTAHISQLSVELVKETIEQERPESVYIELDEKRFESLKEQNRWENLNLKELIRKNQLSTLIANLVMGSYQKRMGDQTGVKPGSELLQAYQSSQTIQSSYKLIDRDIRITLKRVWRKTPWYKKTILMGSLLASIFEKSEVNETELAKIKNKDALSVMIDEMEQSLPTLKHILIDERDSYMAWHLMNNSDKKIIAVVGAGHIPGMLKHLEAKTKIHLPALEEIPKSAPLGKIIGWSVPIAIIIGFLFLGIRDLQSAKAGLMVWILANGIPAGIGAIIALSNPLVIVVAFCMAPITSLIPIVGVGMLTAFVQTWASPPTVLELQSASDDISITKMWWKNKFLKVLLAFILPTLGSAIGTYIGAADLISRLTP